METDRKRNFVSDRKNPKICLFPKISNFQEKKHTLKMNFVSLFNHGDLFYFEEPEYKLKIPK